MVRPGRLWADAPARTKIELQRALLPRGPVVDRALGYGTRGRPVPRDRAASVTEDAAEARDYTMVFDWFEELRARVPVP